MKLVFVHGVATRTGVNYAREEANRNLLLRSVAFAGQPVDIMSPRWGDLVPGIKSAAFPTDHDDDGALAIGQGAFAAAHIGPEIEPNLAKWLLKEPMAILDAVCAELVQSADDEGRGLNSEELAQFENAARMIEAADESSDHSLDDQASAAFTDDQSFGLVNGLDDAAIAISDRAQNLLSSAISKIARPALNPLVARFLGDIFVYLKAGDLRQSIRRVICEDIRASYAARQPGESLVLIGHSLGGVILYDILSAPDHGELPNDFSVELLVTVGSQSGLFQEMGLFACKPGPEPDGRLPGPTNARHWLNIYDPIDVFGFRAEPVFSKAKDYRFNSVTGLLDAHTTYFKRPQFHARLHKRLVELELL